MIFAEQLAHKSYTI